MFSRHLRSREGKSITVVGRQAVTGEGTGHCPSTWATAPTGGWLVPSQAPNEINLSITETGPVYCPCNYSADILTPGLPTDACSAPLRRLYTVQYTLYTIQYTVYTSVPGPASVPGAPGRMTRPPARPAHSGHTAAYHAPRPSGHGARPALHGIPWRGHQAPGRTGLRLPGRI
jgi:hypothetical protein